MLKKLFQFKDKEYGEIMIGKLIGVIVGCIAVGILLTIVMVHAWPFVVVHPGTRGVVLDFGKVQSQVLNEGLHLRIPIMQKIIPVNVQIAKAETQAAAGTKDLQEINTTIALNYHILPEKANWVYQKIGLNFKETIIDPAIQECVKAVTSQFNASDLITQREVVRNKIKDIIRTRLLDYNIKVDDFAIVNFSFSPTFQTAIERKQTAEQDALTAKNKLEQVRYEAEQKMTSARAEAEALRVQKENVTPLLVELRKIEVQTQLLSVLEKKWNGQYPLVLSGDKGLTNLIDLSKLPADGK